MKLEAPRLESSAFINNLGPGERSTWRFLLALVGGLAAFLFISVIAIIAAFAIYVVLLGWPNPFGSAGPRPLLDRFIALAGSDGRNLADELEIIGIGLTSNILPMFAFLGIAALAHRTTLRAFCTAATRFRWRMLVVGLLLATAVIGPFVAIVELMDPKAAPPILTISKDPLLLGVYALVSFIGFVPAALGEEILFRGWLLRQISNAFRNPLILLTANGVIFAAAHFDFAPDAFLERSIMGAGLGYMTLRLSGVELAAGVHASNNLMIVLFISPLTLKAAPNSGFDATSLISYVGLFVAYVGIAEITARWPSLRRWSGADRGPSPTTIAVVEHFS